MEKAELTIQQLLDRLNLLAARDFPVRETHLFLKESSLDPAALQPYLFFDPDQYTRNLIHKSAGFELLAICWMPGQKAPIHGHEGEKCWARVESGVLRFTNYREQSTDDFVDLEITSDPKDGNPGFLDGPADIHSVENPFDAPAVSLHLYSHPYEACEIYDLANHRKERIKLRYYSKFGKPAEQHP